MAQTRRMDLLDRIHKEIADRVAELRPLALEYERLQQAHAALTTGRDAGDTVGRRRASDKPSVAPRARRGSAREMILAAASENPGAKRADIAQATGLSPNTVG